jgi:hypothetical protein
MRLTILPAAFGVALFASCSVTLAQGHHRGGPHVGGGFSHGSGPGAFRGPGPGAMRAPGGFQRSAPMGPRAQYHAPRARHVERAPRATQRSQQLRRAEIHRSQRTQRVQRQLHQGKEAQRAHRQQVTPSQKAVQDRRAPEKASNVQRVTERHNEIQTARTQLTADHRDRLHRAFSFDKARVHNAKFDHHVGRHIPRHVRLFAIPAAIFAFFPYYRDYSYFVVDDEVCIVDPRTYVVVDVIDAGYWNSGPGRPQVAGLQLSDREIALVRDSIPPDFPDSGLQLRLALGAEIADDVPLHEFPAILLERVPQLQQYRFLISADQIVIVQPNNRSIALVIDKR